MTDIVSNPQKIQAEEVAYRRPVSEALATKIGGTVNALMDEAFDVLGEIKICYLTEAQFASLKNYDHTAPIADRKWAIMSGQTISGSDFSTLTGVNTLPDMTTTGRFIGQKRGSDSLGQVESNQNKAHTHNVTIYEYNTGGLNDGLVINYDLVNITRTLATDSNGGDQSKPETLRLNHFIKINL